MRPILIPERASALRADCAPGPGVFVLFPPVALSLMWTAEMPSSCTTRQNANHWTITGAVAEPAVKWLAVGIPVSFCLASSL